MKRTLLVLVGLLVFAGPVAAQDHLAVPLDRVEDYGLTIAGLDSVHAPALHADTSLAVFAGQDQEVIAAWRGLLGELASHLSAEGFTWDGQLRGYHRFYFRPDGRIERVLYHMRGLDAERSARYGEILDAFARDYRIALAADVPFSQCSPVVLGQPAD